MSKRGKSCRERKTEIERERREAGETTSCSIVVERIIIMI
jgi:hypothetical protein